MTRTIYLRYNASMSFSTEEEWKQSLFKDRFLPYKEFKNQIPGIIKSKRKELEELRKEEADVLTINPFWLRELAKERYYEALAKQEKRLHRIIALWKGQSVDKKENEIDDADIARAKEYPITQLLNVSRGYMARCPFHGEDKHPSMSIKKNFAYCFTCGWKGDSIDIYMKLNDTDFITAVKALS